MKFLLELILLSTSWTDTWERSV